MQVTRTTFIPLLAPRTSDRIDPGAVRDEYCGDLTVIYTYGPQFGRRVVTHAELDQMELAPRVLRRSALEHLEVLASRAEFHGQPPALMLSFEGLESSLLLASDFWTRLQGAVPGEIVVGVPARDVVIVTGSQSVPGMEKARRCVDRVFMAGGDFPLTPRLLVRRGGTWEPFDGPTRQPARPAHGMRHQHGGPAQPPRQYQEHPSWPSERVAPVSPTRPAGAPQRTQPGGPPVRGRPLQPAARMSPSRSSVPGRGSPMASPAMNGHLAPEPMAGGMVPQQHGSAGHGQREPARAADVAPYSAVPYSAVPYSAVPYSAVPYSAVPYSAAPYSVAPHHTAPYSAPPATPHSGLPYGGGHHSGSSPGGHSHGAPSYSGPPVSRSRAAMANRPSAHDQKPAYRDDPYSSGVRSPYAEHEPSAAYPSSSPPAYPTSWGTPPDRSPSRPEFRSGPRARFSSR